MNEDLRMFIAAFILCSAVGVLVGADQSSPSSKDVAIYGSDLDYLVVAKSKRVYDLEYGDTNGVLTCVLEVSIDKNTRDTKDGDSVGDLLDLRLTYSQFGCRLMDKGEESQIKSQLRESRIESFEFAATIDKYGRLVSSNLKDRVDPLLKATRKETQYVVHNVLEPMVRSTWLYLFPRLGPVDGGCLSVRDLRSWEAFGWPRLKEDLAAAELGTYFHVASGSWQEPKRVLWARVTEQLASTEYRSDRDVGRTTNIEISYDSDIKSVTKAVVHCTTTFGKEESTTVSFKGTLKRE
jgi:hypothetical protein